MLTKWLLLWVDNHSVEESIKKTRCLRYLITSTITTTTSKHCNVKMWSRLLLFFRIFRYIYIQKLFSCIQYINNEPLNPTGSMMERWNFDQTSTDSYFRHGCSSLFHFFFRHFKIHWTDAACIQNVKWQNILSVYRMRKINLRAIPLIFLISSHERSYMQEQRKNLGSVYTVMLIWGNTSSVIQGFTMDSCMLLLLRLENV
jgi:hypothetical protein